LFKHFSKTFGHGSNESLRTAWLQSLCKATASSDTVGQLIKRSGMARITNARY